MSVKSFILFILAITPLVLWGQTNGRIEFGYQNAYNYAPTFTGIANRYNTSRPWLESQMKLPDWHHGIQIGVYTEPNKFSIGFALTYQWYTGKASGTDALGEAFERKLRSHFLVIEAFDFSYNILKNDHFRFGIGIIPLSFSRSRVSTKRNDEDWKYATHVSLGSNAKKAHWFAGIKLQAHFGANITPATLLKFTFFYHLNYAGSMNLYRVDQGLNPQSVDAYYGGHLFTKPSYFGMRLSFNIITD